MYDDAIMDRIVRNTAWVEMGALNRNCLQISFTNQKTGVLLTWLHLVSIRSIGGSGLQYWVALNATNDHIHTIAQYCAGFFKSSRP